MLAKCKKQERSKPRYFKQLGRRLSHVSLSATPVTETLRTTVTVVPETPAPRTSALGKSTTALRTFARGTSTSETMTTLISKGLTTRAPGAPGNETRPTLYNPVTLQGK
ncbi:hypothetical protein MMC12_005914 [Toensbergia leucococca]|nr:hypothetical protein [Toensbergia leucococca]